MSWLYKHRAERAWQRDYVSAGPTMSVCYHSFLWLCAFQNSLPTLLVPQSH